MHSHRSSLLAHDIQQYGETLSEMLASTYLLAGDLHRCLLSYYGVGHRWAQLHGMWDTSVARERHCAHTHVYNGTSRAKFMVCCCIWSGPAFAVVVGVKCPQRFSDARLHLPGCRLTECSPTKAIFVPFVSQALPADPRSYHG